MHDDNEARTIIVQVYNNLKFLEYYSESLKVDSLLADFNSEWLNSIDWKSGEDYSFLNQGVVLTSLYGLIVYPKEIFYNKIPDKKIEELEEQWGHPCIKLWKVSNSKKNLKQFVKKIRNSLSHGRVLIGEDFSFTFEDGPNAKEINFIVKFNIKGMLNFIKSFYNGVVVGKWDFSSAGSSL